MGSRFLCYSVSFPPINLRGSIRNSALIVRVLSVNSAVRVGELILKLRGKCQKKRISAEFCCIIKQNLDKIRPKIIKNPTSKMLNSVG